MSTRFDKKLVDRVIKRGLYDPIDELLDSLLYKPQQSKQIFTQMGIPSKRNRTDYSRRSKKTFFWYHDKKDMDPWRDCFWLKLLNDPLVNDPRNREAQEFRRLFRVPPQIFREIVNLCIGTGDPAFNYNEFCIDGTRAAPLELKIMSVLRTLSGGILHLDSAAQTQYMSSNACGEFFKIFLKVFRPHYEKRYITPLEGEAFRQSIAAYARLGLPGATGSIDVTFVGPWDGCSANLSNILTGDKGKGLLYEVVVNHQHLVLSVEGGYYGSINDKTSVKFGRYIAQLANNDLYQNYSYRIRTGPGDEDFMDLSSFYVIADGGYLEWPCIMCGFPPDNDPRKYRFTDWVASVRKDVECFFGILKQRFRWLKYPIKLTSIEDVNNVFFVLCMIHNMVLTFDGLDSLWEDGKCCIRGIMIDVE